MRTITTVILLVSLFATDSASAQSPRSSAVRPSAGAVEGDVFMVFRNGDVVPMAGRRVSLLRQSDSLQLDVARFCDRRRQREDSLAARYRRVYQPFADSVRALVPQQQSAVVLEAMRASEEIIRINKRREHVRDSLRPIERAERAEIDDDYLRTILRHESASSRTGLQAHYKFERVPIGDYVLFAETELARGDITLRPRWWAPISITRDSVLRVDLDSDVTQGRPFNCTTP